MSMHHRPPRSLFWPLVVVTGLAFGLGMATASLFTNRGADSVPADATAAPDAGHEPAGPSPRSTTLAPPSTPVVSGSASPTSAPDSDGHGTQGREFSHYESLYRAEARVDASWAQPAEHSLVEAATDESLVAFGVPSEFNARCASRLCKVQMAFEDAAQANDWSEIYVLGMGNAVTLVRSMTVVRQDGKTELILYGTRKGYESLLGESAAPSSRH